MNCGLANTAGLEALRLVERILVDEVETTLSTLPAAVVSLVPPTPRLMRRVRVLKMYVYE